MSFFVRSIRPRARLGVTRRCRRIIFSLARARVLFCLVSWLLWCLEAETLRVARRPCSVRIFYFYQHAPPLDVHALTPTTSTTSAAREARAEIVEHHLDSRDVRVRERVYPIALPIANNVVAVERPFDAIRRDHLVAAAAATSAAAVSVLRRLKMIATTAAAASSTRSRSSD